MLEKKSRIEVGWLVVCFCTQGTLLEIGCGVYYGSYERISGRDLVVGGLCRFFLFFFGEMVAV